MRKFFAILFGIFICLIVAFGWIAYIHPQIIDLYQKNARTPIFSACITLGSFLLTLKTAILQRLKEGFDCPQHEEAYLSYVRDHGDSPYYASLNNMSVALSSCVAVSLVSAIAQMSFGFSEQFWAFAICAAFPSLNIGLLLYLWLQIAIAHNLWIQGIESQKQADLKRRSKL